MDFSKYGIKEGLVKALKIVGWYAASGAIASLIAYFATIKVDQQDLVLFIGLMVINAILAGAAKWLSTCKPTK